MKEVEEGKRKEVGRMGDWRKRQGMGGAQAERKNLKDGGCTFIYCTHSMTDLHAIVVNSFVSRTTPPSHCTVPPCGTLPAWLKGRQW